MNPALHRLRQAGLLALTLAASAHPVAAQATGTLPLQDPAYADLRRLADFGLVPRGLGAPGPYSVARVAGETRDARSRLAQRTDLNPVVRGDLEAILARLERRFGGDAEGGGGVAVFAEGEAGGGRSPGRGTPDNGLGTLAAVVNPLWRSRGGRAAPDRAFGAVAGRVTAEAAPGLALGAAVRGSSGTASGVEPGRGDLVTEALYARVALGRLALQVGRDQVWLPGSGAGALVLGPNGPPLDLIRLGTDQPLRSSVLGEVEVSLLAADLGPRHSTPHAKLFAVLATARPAPALTLGLSLLNKQMGEGAPEATLGERLKDLSWIWDWLSGSEYEFSDKSVGVTARVRSWGVDLLAEATLTDFRRGRWGYTFLDAAGYRVGLAFPTLGASGRHSLRVEGSSAGPFVGRHHQFASGASVDGYPQGSMLGADARGGEVRYGYDAAAAGWRVEVALSTDARSGDEWRAAGLTGGERPTLIRDGTDERRVRLEVEWHALFSQGAAGVDVGVGGERVQAFDFQEGADRTLGAARVRVWRAMRPGSGR